MSLRRQLGPSPVPLLTRGATTQRLHGLWWAPLDLSSETVQNSKAPVAYAGGSATNDRYRTATVRIREKIGSQAKAPVPLIRKSLCVNLGQALSPANPALVPILSRILRETVPWPIFRRTLAVVVR